MRWATPFLMFVLSGCGVAHQPESARTVAAFEVPLPSAAERSEFLALLSSEAKAEGLHLDASTPEELQQLSDVTPMTIHAAVWRGDNDEESLASVMDLPNNLGRAWLSFSKGEDPKLATRFRERAMRKVLARWPTTQALPIMPTGAIPLPADLLLTEQGYRVKPDAASRYELPATSPLVARN